MKTHYQIRALVRDRDNDTLSEQTFDVWAWDDWYPEFSREYGHRWTIIEVLEARNMTPDEVLA